MLLNKPLLTTFALLGLSSQAINAQAGTRSERPNVLFIAVDDLKPVLNCFGESQIKSPNIDRIAVAGTVFTSCYCQQAVCSPSRISLLTGMRPDATGIYDLRTYFRTKRPDAVSIAGCFKQNGYETVARGKIFHGNYDKPSWTMPYKRKGQLGYTAKGFGASVFGYQSPETKKAFIKIIKEISKKRKAAGKKMNYARVQPLAAKRGFSPPYECVDGPDNMYYDGALGLEGVKLLKKLSAGKKPFFLAIGFIRPHLSFNAPKKYWDMYNPKDIKLAGYREKTSDPVKYAYNGSGELRHVYSVPNKFDDAFHRKMIHGYYACVSYIDAQVGKLLDELKRLKLDKNTIVVLWGDHGWHLGDHGMFCKHTNFEQATRSPLIIAAPGYKGGQKTSSLTEFIDVYPTLCKLAGIKPPSNIQGESLVPLMKNPKARLKEFAISQYSRRNKVMGYSLRTKHFRLTLWFGKSLKSYDEPGSKDILAGELYDYQKDPLEKHNVYNNPKYAAIKKNLWEKMQKHFKDSTEHHKEFPFKTAKSARRTK
jgi:iduronate 2-sulfatase